LPNLQHAHEDVKGVHSDRSSSVNEIVMIIVVCMHANFRISIHLYNYVCCV